LPIADFLRREYVKILSAHKHLEGDSMPQNVLLTDENKALILKVSNLLRELVETCSILEEKGTMSSIRQSEKDVKAGRIRDYDEFIAELKQAGEI
jgi:hypothetical protein